MIEDAELLSRYASERSEEAFAEFTRRHVDLVYCAALRLMNEDVHAAQDVTQQVFTEAGLQAKSLAQHPALAGWLYTTTRNLALRVIRTEQRRKAREQEANKMNELLKDDAPADWTQLRPVLEEAMHELDEKDRYAVLLRYFQNRSLKEVGAELNLTDNAARMRVERALDKLRGKLARRGIATSIEALAATVAVNAVQAAPAGFAATVSAAAVAGSAAQFSAALTAGKIITMTTLQKVVVVAALAAAAGTGFYAVHSRSQFQEKIQTLEQQQSRLSDRNQQLEQERDDVTRRLGALKAENARLSSATDARALAKMRGEMGMLRQKAAASDAEAKAPATGLDKIMGDPAMRQYIRKAQMDKIRSLYADFFKEMKMTPDQTDQFLEAMTDVAARSMERLSNIAHGAAEQTLPDAREGLRNQLQELLGDAGLHRFKEYSDEIPGRTTVAMLKEKLDENPLTDEQNARLIQIVKAEPHELTQGITGAPDKVFLGPQTEIDGFMQRLSESNQRVVQQAAGFLAPEQVATLDAVLSTAMNARRLQAAALIQAH